MSDFGTDSDEMAAFARAAESRMPNKEAGDRVPPLGADRDWEPMHPWDAPAPPVRQYPKPEAKVWEVERVTIKTDDEDYWTSVLEFSLREEGWEPFAVTSGPMGWTYHLRRLA